MKVVAINQEQSKTKELTLNLIVFSFRDLISLKTSSPQKRTNALKQVQGNKWSGYK